MNDHELDDQMRHLAQSYNEPPAAPRDAMWARIERARAGAPLVDVGRARRTRWLRLATGLAAVLVVGIGIGRLSRGAATVTPPPTRIAAAPGEHPATVGADPIGDAALVPLAESLIAPRQLPRAEAVARVSGGASSGGLNEVRATRDERIRALRADRAGSGRALGSYGEPRGIQGAVGDGSDMSAYRLAVVEHMARSEVLLTSFLAESRANPSDVRAAAQFAALSRDLLKTTRLLLATRTTDDPALTRLLEDLELVLMQISQYSAEGRRGDLDAINQSLDRRNVLPKLRSTIPAGASASSGT